MHLGYIIIYVDDVERSLSFYEAAFGLERRFLHESGSYGELETGSTALAFVDHETAAANLDAGYVRLPDLSRPAGVEIGLVTDDVPAAVERAVNAGAELMAAPQTKPWGQTVAYLRAPEGMLIELCTPMGG